MYDPKLNQHCKGWGWVVANCKYEHIFCASVIAHTPGPKPTQCTTSLHSCPCPMFFFFTFSECPPSDKDAPLPIDFPHDCIYQGNRIISQANHRSYGLVILCVYEDYTKRQTIGIVEMGVCSLVNHMDYRKYSPILRRNKMLSEIHLLLIQKIQC